MMDVSPRVADYIAHAFRGPRAAEVVGLLASLDLPGRSTPDGDERVCAAVVAIADGDVDRLIAAVIKAEVDWRDVLVSAGLANDDWRERLDQMLGPSSAEPRAAEDEGSR